MKSSSLFLLLFFFLFLYSCKKEDVANTSKPVDSSPIVYNINKANLLKLVNDVRQSGCTCGTTVMPAVAPLTWNDQLAKAAYDHSKDMQLNNYFSHTGLDGSSPGSRMTAEGYIWKTYGENIANGFTTEQSVMNGWLGSEGHCKNIMNAGFKEIGAGRESNYWTQVFGTR